jgi:AcrR family transcriptional regulator
VPRDEQSWAPRVRRKTGVRAQDPSAIRRRSRGGGSRDPAASRERILRAAIGEFAGRGYMGARVDAISRRAGTNPRLIYHYFGSKAALYVAALERVLAELRSEELRLEVAPLAPFEGVLQLFDFIHGHFGAHPELIRLLMSENLQRAQFLKRSSKAAAISSRLLPMIAGLLERGAAEGTMRQGIDPLQLYVAMVALSSYHRSNAHTLSVIFDAALLDQRWQAAQHGHARAILAAFLQPAAG